MEYWKPITVAEVVLGVALPLRTALNAEIFSAAKVSDCSGSGMTGSTGGSTGAGAASTVMTIRSEAPPASARTCAFPAASALALPLLATTTISSSEEIQFRRTPVALEGETVALRMVTSPTVRVISSWAISTPLTGISFTSCLQDNASAIMKAPAMIMLCFISFIIVYSVTARIV